MLAEGELGQVNRKIIYGVERNVSLPPHRGGRNLLAAETCVQDIVFWLYGIEINLFWVKPFRNGQPFSAGRGEL